MLVFRFYIESLPMTESGGGKITFVCFSMISFGATKDFSMNQTYIPKQSDSYLIRQKPYTYSFI